MRAELLLRSLGWEGRYASRFRHEFPDPNMPYRPISTTARQLESRIAGLLGGYLAVIGPPGSGKSVLLTQTFSAPGRSGSSATTPTSPMPRTRRRLAVSR